MNQRLSITMEPWGEQQIALDPHGKLTAQITLDPHGNRAARREGGRGGKKVEAEQKREEDWYREGQNDQLGVQKQSGVKEESV